MAACQLDLGGAPDVTVHLLPALIEHSGPAPVENYFRPQETGATVDGLPVLHCSLRGRGLQGVRLPLPEGYSGAVLECRQQDGALQGEGGSQYGAAGTPSPWAATGTFSHLHYYNHDAAPLKGDGLRRCLEWAELSAHVHRAIDPAAVDAALQPALGDVTAAAAAAPQAG